MLGNNEIKLCMSEAMVAFQEYLDKRMGDYAPRVDDLKMNVNGPDITIVTNPKD